MTGERTRRLAFALIAGVCVAGMIVAVMIAFATSQREEREARDSLAKARPSIARIMAGDTPFVVFRDLDRTHPQDFSRLAIASLTDSEPGGRSPAGPACERLAVSGGRGVCLETAGIAGFNARVLDGRLRTTRSIRLGGTPSRVRISPDGRWGGVTAFVAGHSYAQPGQFSTAATILDLQKGRKLADLERDFTVMRDGNEVTNRDRNFWGLTFADDGDTFYATMGTGGSTYLLRGSVSKRRAETIATNVECPSLSPDGTRIAYKKAVGREAGAHTPVVWRFSVLDLASGTQTPLAEPDSIDDQLEWLDDERLLYRKGNDTWTVQADGKGEPALWLPDADSVVVARRG